MVTKYRCSRCLRTFKDPHEADQHEHDGTVVASIREVDGREQRTEQTRMADWGVDAFQEASALKETDQ